MKQWGRVKLDIFRSKGTDLNFKNDIELWDVSLLDEKCPI